MNHHAWAWVSINTAGKDSNNKNSKTEREEEVIGQNLACDEYLWQLQSLTLYQARTSAFHWVGYETFSKAKLSFGSLIHASYPQPSFETTSVFNICQGKPIETQGLERENRSLPDGSTVGTRHLRGDDNIKIIVATVWLSGNRYRTRHGEGTEQH